MGAPARTLRVFLSSTFPSTRLRECPSSRLRTGRDTRAERERLVEWEVAVDHGTRSRTILKPTLWFRYPLSSKISVCRL